MGIIVKGKVGAIRFGPLRVGRVCPRSAAVKALCIINQLSAEDTVQVPTWRSSTCMLSRCPLVAAKGTEQIGSVDIHSRHNVGRLDL
jgi:hypothetical protein